MQTEQFEYKRANPDWYPLLKEYAKRMRRNPTEAESALWRQLQGCTLGVQFKRQYVILDFIADFFAQEQNLIIEVDGGYHQNEEQMILDERRTRHLEEKGYNILRFTNEEVLYDIDNVLTKIKNYIEIENNE